MHVNQISDDEKRRYVEMYHTSGLTLAEIGRQAGVTKQSVSAWVKKFTITANTQRSITVSKSKNRKEPQVDPRDAEIARLKAALEKAELRAHALDTMINVAEETLKIKIRKKAGAKQ